MGDQPRAAARPDIEPLDNPGPYYRELHEILELHNGRLNHMPWPYQPSFFEKVKANLRENVVIYAATAGGPDCRRPLPV